MEFSRKRHDYTQRYLREVFGAQDQHLAGLMGEAVAAGLPDIAVSADVGQLLHLLVGVSRSDAEPQLVVELGTLGGYSTIWLARGLAPGGKVITVELDGRHARFAQEQFGKAKVADQVELRQGAALDVLGALTQELGPGSVDLFFFDAVKREYAAYWQLAKPLLRRGGLLVADNCLGADWWIDEEGNPDRDAIDRFNRALVLEADLDVACVPLREGVLVARKR